MFTARTGISCCLFATDLTEKMKEFVDVFFMTKIMSHSAKYFDQDRPDFFPEV